MQSNRSERTVLFADICDSTALYDQAGDEPARALIGAKLQAASAVVQAHGGTVIKSIGDAILCTFPATEPAVRAALRMQETPDDTGPSEPAAGLRLRIGLQHGPVLEESHDIFGDAVNLAARLTSLAKSGQILTTEAAVARLPDELRAASRHLDTLSVKGKFALVKVYEVLVEEDDATRLMSGLFAINPSVQSLTLRAPGGTWTLGRNSLPLHLGRGHLADVIVEDSRVSRQHASVLFRRDKFILADQSANGTYVDVAGDVHYLRREEIELQQQGRISLGRSFNDPACLPLDYGCEAVSPPGA